MEMMYEPLVRKLGAQTLSSLNGTRTELSAGKPEALIYFPKRMYRLFLTRVRALNGYLGIVFAAGKINEAHSCSFCSDIFINAQSPLSSYVSPDHDEHVIHMVNLA